MSTVYQRNLTGEQRVSFLLHADTTSTGKTILRITRSDAPDNPLYDLIVMEGFPIDLTVTNGTVSLTRLEETKLP